MLSLHFGPFLVVWKVVWNEMSFKVPSKVPDHPGIPGLLYEQMFSGLGWVRREQPRAQVPPARPGHRTKRKSSGCTKVTFAEGQDEVYASLRSHISLS